MEGIENRLRLETPNQPKTTARKCILAEKARPGCNRLGLFRVVKGADLRFPSVLMVLGFTISGGKIVEIDAIADPERLRQLDLTVLAD
jgi:hypothetical protein